MAAELGRPSSVNALIQAGAELGIIGSNRRNTLSLAMEYGHLEIKARAEVLFADTLGQTALSWAAKSGNGGIYLIFAPWILGSIPLTRTFTSFLGRARQQMKHFDL
jgi:ankyrin repeat protein